MPCFPIAFRLQMRGKGEQGEVGRAGLATGANDAAGVHLPLISAHARMHLIHLSSGQLSKKSPIV